MKEKICATIDRNHIYYCSSKTIGRQGENLCMQLELTLEDCLCDSWVYLHFEKPDGTTKVTERLDIVDNVVTYDIGNDLLEVEGALKVVAELHNDNGLVWKSSTKTYTVLKSFSGTDQIENKTDFITEAQKLLNEVEEGLTPTIGENGNWFICEKDTGKPSRGEEGKAGKDYVITDEDYEVIEKNVRDSIQPSLDNNLEAAKKYADDIKPTKTSELTNDSNFAKTNQYNNFSVPQTINGGLTINGYLVQSGEVYETHAEKLYTEKNEIILRDKAVGGMSEDEFAGLIALLYNGIVSGRLGFKADGTAYVGDVGDEQPLLTRDEVENLKTGQVLVWDGTNLKAVGSDAYVKNTDFASMTKAGVIKTWMSTNEDGEIGLNISTEE